MFLDLYKPEGGQSPRRLGGALRHRLRVMPEGATLVVDLGSVSFPEPCDDAVFEVLVTMNCCSTRGPLKGKRIVVCDPSSLLLSGIQQGLSRIGFRALAMVRGIARILGDPLPETARLVYDQVKVCGLPGATARHLKETTDLSRPAITGALDDLVSWGLVLPLSQSNLSTSGKGRPATFYAATEVVVAAMSHAA